MSFSRFTGHNSPLQNRPSENEPGHPGYLYNVKDTIELYMDLGMDPGQMVIGVPTYGRGFQLEDNDLNGREGNSWPCNCCFTPFLVRNDTGLRIVVS